MIPMITSGEHGEITMAIEVVTMAIPPIMMAIGVITMQRSWKSRSAGPRTKDRRVASITAKGHSDKRPE